MKHEDIKMDKKTVKKAVGMHESQLHGGKKSDLKALKGGGCAKMAMKKMATGGMAMVEKDGKKVPAFAADGKGKMAKGGCAKMAKGGSASKRADGCATKGKTKGRMI
jgi:hypothetical protein